MDEYAALGELEPSSPTSNNSSNGRQQSDLTLDDVQGQVFAFATDQYGSRFLQQRIAQADDMEKQMAFKEIRPFIRQLSTHVFGNYIIQKFLEYGSSEQHSAIMNSFRGRWCRLSLDLYGCRVVQKAIDVLTDMHKVQPFLHSVCALMKICANFDFTNTQIVMANCDVSYCHLLQFVIVNELVGRMVDCVMHQNGNHVIQRCITNVSPSQLDLIVNAFVGNVSHCNNSKVH